MRTPLYFGRMPPWIRRCISDSEAEAAPHGGILKGDASHGSLGHFETAPFDCWK